MTKQIIDLCKGTLRLELNWDFYEDAEDASVRMWNTVPGHLVKILKDHVKPEFQQRRTTALWAAFAARRSLACWFEYCESDQPLQTIAKVVPTILAVAPLPRLAITEADLKPCKPMENGIPIIDCRAEDTLSSSSAVAHAAACAVNYTDEAAIIALCHAHIAFNASPAGSVHVFTKWLFDVALRAALERRELTQEEQAAYADFPAAQLFGKLSTAR